MAAAAEQPPGVGRDEQYAHSFSKLRLVGQAIIEHEVELLEVPAYVQSRDNFVSSLREMMRTDPEFHGSLDIDDQREHAVYRGQVCDIDGVPMVDIIKRGSRVSEAMAEVDSRLSAQAIRDKGDVITAWNADNLKVGESYFALSMDPKDELEQYPEIYEKRFGYREGLMYIQHYSRTEEGVLVAGSYSVDMSDETVWRQVLDEVGVSIPPGESLNNWIRHGFRRPMDAGQASEFIFELRAKYYEKCGITGERLSVSEYVANNIELVDQYYGQYYRSLAEAVYSGQNNDTMRSFAQALLQGDAASIKPEVRSHLVRIANARLFDDDLGRTMDSAIRYAVVEELRAGLKHAMTNVRQTTSLVSLPQPTEFPMMTIAGMPPELVHYRLAQSFNAGVAAGREYGGCSGQVQMSSNESAVTSSGNTVAEGGSQTAYGGKVSQSEGVGVIRIGPCKVPACPTRPRAVKVGGCGVCIARCQILFDKGVDPTKEKPRKAQAKAKIAGNLALAGAA